MAKSALTMLGVAASLCMSTAQAAPMHLFARPVASHPGPVQSEPPFNAVVDLDPTVFFNHLVDRYRGLNLYKDVIQVLQVTRRDGKESQRVHTQITCDVADGQLTVQTPSSSLRKSLGVQVPVTQSKPAKEAQQRYDLWLAPHMALKFADDPLKQLRAGVSDGFVATDAEHVTIDNKRMVHVELRNGSCDGAIENCTAKVDLYVNSDSMLIERIETAQKLPDGADYTTTLQITPQEAEGEMPSSESRPVTPPITRPAL